MRVPVQIISFSCFLFSVTVVRGQEITCEVPRDQNVYDPHAYFGGNRRLGAENRYYCTDGDRLSEGSVATCTRDGWTPKPLCPEITCREPDISNGFVVESAGEYQRDAILKYGCLKGFKAREGIPRCAKFGWTLNPECDEVTCELKSRFGVKKINPEGKTIFRAEESVQITCAEGFQIINTKDPFRTFTCQENREWDHEPVCEEIRCEVPRDQNVYNPHAYFRGDRKLGAEKRYSCKSGYESKTEVATCTQDGWTPNPLCAEKMCAAPIIPNAEILADRREKYSKYSRIQYHCYPGFEPDQHVEITCNPQTGWTGIRPCTVDVRCNIPPKVENALITSKPTKFYKDGSSVTYVCRSSFLMKGKSTVSCRSGSWEEAPTCKEATCSLNTAEEDLKIERPPDREGPVKPGDKLIFSCNSEGLELKGEREITCQSDGEWSSPFPKCEEVMCVAKLTVNMTSDGHPGSEVSVRPGDTITLSCVGSGVTLEGDSKISCLSNGEWNVPFPKCIGGKCGPPPLVNFADTTEMTKNEYDSGERVEYTCFNKYTLVQSHPYSKYMTCEHGEWRGNIKCLKPCTVSLELMDERGIALRWGEQRKIFSPHGDEIEFRCQRGKSSIGLRQRCNDGEMDLPQCV